MELDFIDLNTLDWIIIGLVSLLLIWHVAHGFTRNLIALFVWVLAFLVATIFSASAQEFLMPYIKDAELLELVPFALIFVFSFIFIKLIIFFILVNFITSFVTSGAGERIKPLVRLLAAFSALPLIGVQLLVLLQFSRLFAVHWTEYWHVSTLVPFALQLEGYWNSWVLSALCDYIAKILCVA